MGEAQRECGICGGTEEVKEFETEPQGDLVDRLKLLCVYCWAQLMAGDDDGVLDRQVRNGVIEPPRGWPFRDAQGRFRSPREPYP